MPYSDETKFWRVRIPVNMRKRIDRQAKNLGFTSISMLLSALDEWLQEREGVDRK